MLDKTKVWSSYIAIYLPSLCGGGAERVMVTLANGFVARGHRVDLVLARAEGPYLAEVDPAVRVVDLGVHRVAASLLPLVRYLRQNRPEAMLAALNHANIVAILARALSRVRLRLVVSERNSLTGIGRGVRARMFIRLMRWFYPMADAVVSVSDAMARELKDRLALPAEKVTSIGNPMDIDAIRSLAQQRPVHPWLAPGGPPVVLAAGRLEPQKDFALLIDAFARLRVQREARLVILGEGSCRGALEMQAARLGLTSDIAMPGFESNPFGWMHACKLFVLSSRFEGFPNVLAQAMACGARVVSTDCPTGPGEILEGGKWGQLVPVGDSSALAEAMREALDCVNSPDVSLRVTDFSLERILDKYGEKLLS